jgi:Predicted transcriptional regulator
MYRFSKYSGRMDMTWLRRQMAERNLTQRDLAAVAGMTEQQFTNVVKGRRRFAAAEVDAIRRHLGYRLPEDGSPAVAVAGRVGAGAKVDLVDAYEKGDGLYRVAVPEGISSRGIVAVEVEGDSMVPVYQPGTVLLYSRDTVGVPTEAIGKICVCEDTTGRAWVKVIRTGIEEGTFSLISLNPEAENMHGVRLAWAAPVKFSIPPEYVRKVE